MNDFSLKQPRTAGSHPRGESSIERRADEKQEPLAAFKSIAPWSTAFRDGRISTANPTGEKSIKGQSELNGLADPDGSSSPISISGFEKEVLDRMLYDMRLIRITEEACAKLIEFKRLRAPCHLGIGQEAVAVGVSLGLRASDRVFGGHRSHAHYLGMGGDVYRLLAEVLGKADGASHGIGGSMHICARSAGFYGSVPLIGATIPIAVGAALAAKMEGSGDVGVAYFGDGATEEGVLHESMNLASLHRLPVLFVCENNLYSTHLDIELRQPSDRVARFAEAHRITARTVDGNDVVAVAKAAGGLIEDARAGQGPGFLEAVTYRHLGHLGYKDDVHLEGRRGIESLNAWKMRDPIRRLENALLLAGVTSQEEINRQDLALRSLVSSASDRAIAAPFPEADALLASVFSKELCV